MPYRTTPLVTGQYYHIFNRGIDKRPLYHNRRDYQRFLDTLLYYQTKLPLKFSSYLNLTPDAKEVVLNQRALKSPQVEIICYCLMPNHFHLVITQTQENGISNFMRHAIDSFTRYFNSKYDRLGALLQGRFKSVLVESDEQLWHLSRYIHLNPLTAYIVKNTATLNEYPWSSLQEYISPATSICQKDIILNHFRLQDSYLHFIHDQVDYQRKLATIQHLVLEATD